MTALEQLAERAGRLSGVLMALSRRSDALELRARMLLELLERRCPPGRAPSKPWYVPGAVSRVGLRGLVPSLGRDVRVLRRHARVLEDACLIVRSPGDWLPMRETAAAPKRYADTLHVIDTELEALWWVDVGDRRLAGEPDARTNPTTWSRCFGRWRAEAAEPQLFDRPEVAKLRALPAALPSMLADDLQEQLPFGRPAGPAPFVGEQVSDNCQTTVDAADLLIAANADDGLDVLRALEEAGAPIRGRNAAVVASDLERLRVVVARLAMLVDEGANIGNAAGWIVSAWKSEARKGSRA